MGVIAAEFIKHSWSGETRYSRGEHSKFPRGESIDSRGGAHTQMHLLHWSVHVEVVTLKILDPDIRPINGGLNVWCCNAGLLCRSCLLYKSLVRHILWMNVQQAAIFHPIRHCWVKAQATHRLLSEKPHYTLPTMSSHCQSVHRSNNPTPIQRQDCWT